MNSRHLIERSPIWLIIVAILLLLLALATHAATPLQRSTYFDGSSNSGIGYGDSTQYEPSISMTVEAWIYREDATRCETIVGRTFSNSYWFGTCGGALRFYRNGGLFADADVTIGEGTGFTSPPLMMVVELSSTWTALWSETSVGQYGDSIHRTAVYWLGRRFFSIPWVH